MRCRGIVSGNWANHEEARDYVRGYEPRATFPHHQTQKRITICIDELQFEERQSRISVLKKEFKGGPCVGLQLDMWTDSETHAVFAALNMTTVMEPKKPKEMDLPQLLLNKEVLDFDTFPQSEHTAENIAAWLKGVLDRNKLADNNFNIIVGVAPDGASDGQAALNSITGLGEKTDTCDLHVLQRAVLFALGLAGAGGGKNPDCKKLIVKGRRIVQLSRQSREVNDGIHDRQVEAGILAKNILTTTTTMPTRWGNQYLQLSGNNMLKPVLDPTIEQYKRKHRDKKDAVVDHDEIEGSAECVPAQQHPGIYHLMMAVVPVVQQAWCCCAGQGDRLQHSRVGSGARAGGVPQVSLRDQAGH